LGCDVEWIAPRSHEFVTDYFKRGRTIHDRRRFRSPAALVLNALMERKESALKSLGVGLRADTRSVVVSPIEPSPILKYLGNRCA